MPKNLYLVGRKPWRNHPNLIDACRDPRIRLLGQSSTLPPPDDLPVDDLVLLIHCPHAAPVERSPLGEPFHDSLPPFDRLALFPTRHRRLIACPTHDDHIVTECVRAGATGIVDHTASAAEVVAAVCRVAAGKMTFPQTVLDRIVTTRGRAALTPRTPHHPT